MKGHIKVILPRNVIKSRNYYHDIEARSFHENLTHGILELYMKFLTQSPPCLTSDLCAAATGAVLEDVQED